MSSSRRIPLLIALFVLICSPLFGANEAADSKEAKRKFGEGTAALKAGRFRDAASAFEAACTLRPHGSAALAAALAWEKADDSVRAADDFALALAIGSLAPKDQASAQDRLRALEESLGTAAVAGPATFLVHFEDSTELHPPARLHAQPGLRMLVVVRGDETERRELSLKAGASIDVDVTEPLPAPSASAPPKHVQPPPSVSLSPPDPQPPSHRTRKIIGYTAIGAGVLSGGAAVILGLQTLKARDDYQAAPSRDGYDHAVSMRMWTNVAWAGAAVLGGVGATLVLWPSGKSKTGENSAQISLTPSPNGVHIAGVF